MDKFQAIFEILLILSGVDGHIHKREIKVIKEFLEANIGDVKFDPQVVIKKISNLKREVIIEELKLAATVLKNQCDAEDRITILKFAVELISADGKIIDKENAFLCALGELWNIDMQEFTAYSRFMR